MKKIEIGANVSVARFFIENHKDGDDHPYFFINYGECK